MKSCSRGDVRHTDSTQRSAIQLTRWDLRKMETDRGSVSPSFRCVHAPGLLHTGLASRRFNNGPERCRGFVSVVVAADPYRTSAGLEGQQAQNSFGPEPRASKRHDLLRGEQASIRDRATLWGRSVETARNAAVSNIDRLPGQQKIIRPKHRWTHQRFNSLSVLTPETAHPSTHPRSLIGTHIHPRTECK
jgi:hypothetical protein